MNGPTDIVAAFLHLYSIRLCLDETKFLRLSHNCTSIGQNNWNCLLRSCMLGFMPTLVHIYNKTTGYHVNTSEYFAYTYTGDFEWPDWALMQVL